MKRSISVMVGVFLFIVIGLIGSAWAGTKPPKRGCLAFEDLLDRIMFTVKRSRSLMGPEGKVRLYTIAAEGFAYTNGEPVYSTPMVGSGHMDGDTFHFSLQGNTYSLGLHVMTFYEGFLNVVEGTGTLNWLLLNGDTLLNSGTSDITLVDCTQLNPIPYSQGLGEMKSILDVAP